jgi:hypothetical protein
MGFCAKKNGGSGLQLDSQRLDSTKKNTQNESLVFGPLSPSISG